MRPPASAALGRFDVKIDVFKTREWIAIGTEFVPPGSYGFLPARQANTSIFRATLATMEVDCLPSHDEFLTRFRRIHVAS